MIKKSVPEDDIRFCPYCGHKVAADYSFCHFCGNKLPRSPAQQLQPDTKEKTVPAPSAEKPAPAPAQETTHDAQTVHHDRAKKDLHRFKTANAYWLSDSDYGTLLDLMVSAIRKNRDVKPEEVLWCEENTCIRVSYKEYECGYHDKTSGTHYYVELKQYTGETDHLSWESSDLPCEGQAVIKHEETHERPFGDYDDSEETVRVLKRLFGTDMYWEFTEYFHSYYY